jgi:hypothetical protein
VHIRMVLIIGWFLWWGSFWIGSWVMLNVVVGVIGKLTRVVLLMVVMASGFECEIFLSALVVVVLETNSTPGW